MRIFPGKWLRIKICKKNTFLLLIFWASCWIFGSTFLFAHRSLFSDRCTDEESKKMLAGLEMENTVKIAADIKKSTAAHEYYLKLGADGSPTCGDIYNLYKCYDYNNRAVTGDLCEDLCVTEKLIYKQCLYYQRGKKVLQADWQGTAIILKSKNDAFSKFQAPMFLDESDAQSLTDTELLVMVAVEIKNTLGLDLPNGTLLPLWPERKHSQNWKVELASMWSLYQQEEYLVFNLLQDFSKHVLHVVGTCGHFYAVEFLNAGHSWRQNLFSLEEVVGQSKTGEEKMKAVLDIAISFLDMVHQFDNEFSHRLHLCDVKPENFAIRSDLTVVAIDMDMAFFEPKMRNILEQKCTSDKDCNFFDCFSTCDLKTFMCGAQRENSNLQVICDKIFRRWFTLSIMGSSHSFPLQAELHKAVQKCAESTNMETLFSDLYSLLQASQRLLHKGNM